jgi:hypothetical protein
MTAVLGAGRAAPARLSIDHSQPAVDLTCAVGHDQWPSGHLPHAESVAPVDRHARRGVRTLGRDQSTFAATYLTLCLEAAE